MSPIYRSLTARVEATMEGGVLFVRSYNDGKRGPWERYEGDLAELPKLYRAAADERDSTLAYRLGCLCHCVRNDWGSKWYVEPTSERLAREIRELQRKRKNALKAEAADRPKLEVTPCTG